MRFDCHKRYFKKKEWHKWFAWYPVEVAERDCRWMETIERKGNLIIYSGDCYWEFEYRAIND